MPCWSPCIHLINRPCNAKSLSSDLSCSSVRLAPAHAPRMQMRWGSWASWVQTCGPWRRGCRQAVKSAAESEQPLWAGSGEGECAHSHCIAGRGLPIMWERDSTIEDYKRLQVECVTTCRRWRPAAETMRSTRSTARHRCCRARCRQVQPCMAPPTRAGAALSGRACGWMQRLWLAATDAVIAARCACAHACCRLRACWLRQSLPRPSCRVH